jgi:peptide/nickel transport system permease protein
VTGFILRRLVFGLLTVLLASIIVFAATQVLPGDVARMVLGREAGEAAVQQLRAQLGLDRPLVVQYGSWLAGFVHGDWGQSLSTDSAVRPLIFNRLNNSLRLALVAFAMYVPLGIILGLVAAVRRNTWLDSVISVTSLAFVGIPEFVTGILLIAVFAVRLKWFPASSFVAPSESFLEALPSLILPAVTVSLTSLAYIIRMTRSSTVETMSSDYVRTAYLKGLSGPVVLFRHILRNALLPTVTVIAVGIGWLVGGLIVTESVFQYPGLGRLVLFAIQRRDLPLIQATTMLIVVVFMLSNLLADVIYAVLNPRIRYQ